MTTKDFNTMQHFKTIEEIAKKRGWETIAVQPESYMISFKRNDVRVNVYEGRRGITVVTSLDHPKRGKTQLVRKNVTMKLVDEILSKPRLHTGIGYYKVPKNYSVKEFVSPDHGEDYILIRPTSTTIIGKIAQRLITFLEKYVW